MKLMVDEKKPDFDIREFEKNQQNADLSIANSDTDSIKEEIKTKKTFNHKIFIFAVLAIFLFLLIGAIALLAAPEYFNSLKSLVGTSRQKGQAGLMEKVEELGASGEKMFDFTLTKPVFAKFQNSDTALVPALPPYIPRIKELDNLDAFNKNGFELNQDQSKALEEFGFFITENNFIKEQTGGIDDFADMYAHYSGSTNKYYREPDNALFVSSDAALHLYHILIDRSFQMIEEEKFYPMLKSMTESLFFDSIEKYQQEENVVLKDTYKRLSVFYLIPLVVLDAPAQAEKLDPSDFTTFAQYMEAEEAQNQKQGQSRLEFALTEKKYKNIELDEEVFNLAQAEIGLIYNAKGISASPLFTPFRPYFENDYSQFKPRSHYTKNQILRSYFIAMMWYGRMGFSLDSKELTRDAIAITGQINSLSAGEGKISDIYSTIATAVEFFVGEVDDLTPYEYSNLIKKQYGTSMSDRDFVDDKKLVDFIAAGINQLPRPRIVSEAVWLYDDGGKRDELLKQLMQFRFMGQRFTPDAYVLNNLTQGVGAPDPETGQKLPSMTSALMPIYIISDNNSLVREYIDEWVIKNAPDSDKIINKKLSILDKEFNDYPADIWTQNIYWNWLNAYRPLLNAYGDGYPFFMSSNAWQKKNIGTVLGSYTELKHDTLLYAKQSYAERGGGGNDPAEIPPVPKGYVEADYDFWSRISELARITNEGLIEQKLMPQDYQYRFEKFIEYSLFFQDIVKKELANEIISEDEFEKLRASGHIFQNLTSALPGKELADKERRAGIIADIHTDAVKGKILYEATGKPYIIYVAVKDKNGTRLTRGAVFSHYEFIEPLDERLADEDWQKKVYEGEGELPEKDKWSREIIK